MLKNKVVLITGSSRGIGKATAIVFAKVGAKVILNNHNDLEELKEARKEIEDLGYSAEIVQADISKKEEVNDLKRQIEEKFGKLDILVNNAGILRKEFPTKENWKYWDEILKVNLKGLAMCSYILSEIMSDGSAMINLASVWGLELPAYDANAYSASKAGVVNLTKSLALQLAPKIRVNAVAPSIVATEMLHKNNPETKKWLEENVPLKRRARVEEVAELILFLASDKA